MELLNTVVAIVSLILGGFAIWLSVHFYEKANEAERRTAQALEQIKTQADMLQKLTGRWMDRFTRHATEPRPADEGLMQLVQVVAALPQTMLAHIHVLRPQPEVEVNPQRVAEIQEPWVQESVLAYATLYYYESMANCFGQGLLPRRADFDENNGFQKGIRNLVDKSARDFAHLKGIIAKVHESRLQSTGVKPWMDEANEYFVSSVATAEEAWVKQE